MPYIYSTLSQDNKYVFYKKIDVNGLDRGRPHEAEREILIKGGTGVIDSRGMTAQFSETKVTSEELEFLKTHTVFQMHENNGFIVVSEKRIGDENKVIEGMNKQDESAQLTEGELENGSNRIKQPGAKTLKNKV